MLLGDFYVINEISSRVQDGGEVVEASIALNKDHRIFEGHFPGQPVVPGVCMLQMVREITAAHLKRSLRIESGNNLKFLAILDPVVHPAIRAEIQVNATGDGQFDIDAKLYTHDITFFKLKAVFSDSVQ